jgi:hypothetical protein
MTVGLGRTKVDHASAGEFAPIRANDLIVGRFGLATSILGLIVGLPFVPRPAFELVVAVALAVFMGALIFLTMRATLKKVVPLPPGAVVVPATVPTGRLVASALVTLTLVVLSFLGVLSVALLGGTVGTSLAVLWAARQVQRFEREDGRCVLRRRGSPWDKYLYAGPCP